MNITKIATSLSSTQIAGLANPADCSEIEHRSISLYDTHNPSAPLLNCTRDARTKLGELVHAHLNL